MEAQLRGPQGILPLSGGATTIGRAPDNQITLSDPQVSAHHAEIRPEGMGYSIVDKGSSNGTFLNEQRLAPHTSRPLNPEDSIRIGSTSFVYESASPAYDATIVAPPSASAGQPAPNFGSPPSYPQQQRPSPNFAPSYQQQAAPGFTPSFIPPAVPAKKKSPAGLIILLVIAVLVIGGGIFAYMTFSSSSPEKTFNAYCDALKNGDYHKTYSYLSTNLQSKEPEQQYVSTLQRGSAFTGPVQSCQIKNVQVNGARATGDETFIYGKLPTQPFIVQGAFVKEGSTWKIDVEQQQQLPQQLPGNKLPINPTLPVKP